MQGYFATIITSCVRIPKVLRLVYRNTPHTAPSEPKVHRCRQDPGRPHVGPMNLAIRADQDDLPLAVWASIDYAVIRLIVSSTEDSKPRNKT